MTTVAASDRLLDSLGSSTPFLDSNDWADHLLLRWHDSVVARPMPEWVTA